MSVKEIIIRKNAYHDSMVLMQVNHQIASLPGVQRVALMMATENNKPFLRYCGFIDPRIDEAAANDLVIGVEAQDGKILEETLARVDGLIQEMGKKPKRGRRYASLDSACNAFPGANWAVISVPGQFAGREAAKALRRNLNVFLFSDNVSVQEEIELKRLAQEKERLLLGPDCGTAIINGVGLGFANAVSRGPVGIVGAAGTGIQELCALLERFGGLGVSQALGTGGRDLSEKVEGRGAVLALDFLAKDPGTHCIIFISKPPAEKIAGKILRKMLSLGKPGVVCFLGLPPPKQEGEPLHFAESIEDAAWKGIQIMGGNLRQDPAGLRETVVLEARKESLRLQPDQRFCRGIFSGGSFCYESMIFLQKITRGLYSNTPISGVGRLPDSFVSKENTLVDLGEDEFTRGRVHPMIDPTPVAERIKAESRDPGVGVILFDVILGYGTHPDPAAVLAPAVLEAKSAALRNGKHLIITAHVCGTANDPQNLSRQEEELQNAGVIIWPTNLAATRFTAAALEGILNGQR